MPVIIHDGTLMDEHGGFIEEAGALFQLIGDSPSEPYVAIIQTRRSRIDQQEFGNARLAGIAVLPLSARATRQLLIQRLKLDGINLTEEQTTSLLTLLEGYPPAVQFAVEYANQAIYLTPPTPSNSVLGCG
jgi:hypothetical protein